jgi:hypothetical protein
MFEDHALYTCQCEMGKNLFPYELDMPGRNKTPENTHPLACFLKLPGKNEFIKYQINLGGNRKSNKAVYQKNSSKEHITQ